MFEKAMVNESSVFEPLKFYCTFIFGAFSKGKSTYPVAEHLGLIKCSCNTENSEKKWQLMQMRTFSQSVQSLNLSWFPYLGLTIWTPTLGLSCVLE